MPEGNVFQSTFVWQVVSLPETCLREFTEAVRYSKEAPNQRTILNSVCERNPFSLLQLKRRKGTSEGSFDEKDMSNETAG